MHGKVFYNDEFFHHKCLMAPRFFSWVNSTTIKIECDFCKYDKYNMVSIITI